MPDQLTLETWRLKHDEIQASVAHLKAEIASVAPDVLIVIGDDQRELYLDDIRPTFSIFWGKEIWDLPGSTDKLSPLQKASRWAIHADDPEPYPVASDMARHLIAHMMVEGFDVAQSNEQPKGRSVGHAWTFVRRRLLGERPLPIIPIMINTFFPPNQPSPARCFALGEALRRAVEVWPGRERVGVVASGGLSHFVIDEALDRRVIDGLKARDKANLTSIPREQLQSGSSEILNWIAAAGAVQHLRFELKSYVPAYRSPAGTGCGMTFGTFR